MIGFKDYRRPYCSLQGKILSRISLNPRHFQILIGPNSQAWFVKASETSSAVQEYLVFSHNPSNRIIGLDRVHIS